MMVRNLLKAGYGVEDIHVLLKRRGVVPNQPDHVRAEIRLMRAEGTLSELYKRKPCDKLSPPKA